MTESRQPDNGAEPDHGQHEHVHEPHEHYGVLPPDGVEDLTDKLTGFMYEIELGGLSDIIGQVLDDFLEQCGGMPDDLMARDAFEQISRGQLAVTLAYQLGRLEGRSPQLVENLVWRVARSPCLYKGVQLILIVVSPIVGGKPGVTRPVRRADCLNEVGPLLVVESGYGAPLVFTFAAVGVVRRYSRVRRAIPGRIALPSVLVSVDRPVQYGRSGQRYTGLDLRQIYPLAFPGAVAVMQRHNAGHRPVISRRVVHVRKTPSGGLLSGQAGHISQTGNRLGGRAPRDVFLVLSCVSETGQAEIYNVGTYRTLHLVVQSPALQDGRAEVLDYYVRRCDEIVHSLSSARVQHVERRA